MESNGNNGNGHANGNGNVSPGIPTAIEPKYSRDSIRERRNLVEQAMLVPLRPVQIWNGLKARFPIGYQVIKKDMTIIRRLWAKEDKLRSGQRREEALRRYVRKMQQTDGKNWAVNHAFEVLYARVGGFLEGPLFQNNVQINQSVHIHSRVTNVLANLSEDEQRKIAHALALSDRGDGFEKPALPQVSLGVDHGPSSGIEPRRIENAPQGSD